MATRKELREIAEAVEDKMSYMGSCPNERDIILAIIAPLDYNRKKVPHCATDCWNKNCKSYARKK